MTKFNGRRSDSCDDIAVITVSNCQNSSAMEATEQGDAESRPSVSVGFVRSDRLGLVCILVAYFMSNSVVTLQGPFYPTLASRKNLSPSTTGLILGIYSFVSVFVPPLAGKLLSKTTVAFVTASGCFILGGCAICLSVLQWSPPGTTFLVSSIPVMAGQGIGVSFVGIAVYAYAATAFSRQLATINGGLGIISAVASSLTPILGGLLQEIGGFVVPYATFGGITLLSCLAIMIWFPKNRSTVDGDEEERIVGMFVPLKHLAVCLQLVISSTTNFLDGFNSATSTFHLQQISPNISASTIGLVFFGYAGSMAISSQVAGVLMDRIHRVYVPLFVGLILYIIAFSLCGPMWPIDMTPTLYLVIVAQIIAGMAYGILNVGGNYLSFVESYSAGCPNNDRTNGAVSALIWGLNSLAATVGSVVGGVLYDRLGYGEACTFAVALTVVIFLITLTFTLVKQRLSVTQ